eukprot:12685271-Heterocapsa_arctica.AAC.1
MRGGTPFTFAFSPCHVVGVVARLDDGLVRRVRGRLVAAERKHVVLAVPAGVFGSDEVPLEKCTLKNADGTDLFVNLVKVPQEDVTSEYEGWGKKVPHLDGIEMRE